VKGTRKAATISELSYQRGNIVAKLYNFLCKERVLKIPTLETKTHDLQQLFPLYIFVCFF
jgi:hypothetical protein